jgi:hypothetical protein
MKKYIQYGVSVLFVTYSTVALGQIDGLLNKAKKIKKQIEQTTSPASSNNNSKQDAPESNTGSENSTPIVSASSNGDPNVPEGYYCSKNELGKIILSTKPNNTDATGQLNFNSSQNIYGKLILNKGTIKEALQIGEKDKTHPYYFYDYDLYIYKNKKEVFHNNIWNTILLTDDELSQNFLNFDVLPDPNAMQTIRSGSNDFCCGKASVPLFDAIKPEVFTTEGIYKVDIIIRNTSLKDNWGNPIKDQTKFPNFEVDFDFNFSNADIAKLKSNKDIANEKAKENFLTVGSKVATLPDSWTAMSGNPMAGYSLAKYNQLYQKYYPNNKIIKTHMTSDNGWSVIKDNDNFLPRYKYSSQWVTYFVKNNKGQCYYHTCNLRQNYEGGGTYSSPFLAVFEDEIKYIDCSKLN